MLNGSIRRISTLVIEMPFKKSWEISLYSANSRPHLLVMVETEEGVFGFGESSPSTAFMGETAYTDQEIIERNMKQSIVGLSVFDRSALHATMDRIAYMNNGVKTALDLAVHDAAAKILKVPVCHLLGGRIRKKVPQAWVVAIQEVTDGVQDAKNLLAKGYRSIKVKVGINLEREVSLLKEIRKELGTGFQLRVDANQGFSVRKALYFLDKVRDLDLECMEQPVPRWDIKGLREVRLRGGVPIMADESCSSLHDAIRVVESEAADILNIKVTNVGGLYSACQVAAIAEAAGLSAVAGSNIEAGLGSMANIHFAASQACITHDSDQICVPLYERDLLEEEIPLEKGMVEVKDTPGFGVSLRKEYIEELLKN